MSEEPVQSADHRDFLIERSADIASAYVSHNALSPADLPKLIADVYRALNALHAAAEEPVVPDLVPAVSIRKSVTPDYIVCLDDGRQLKSMKRHLAGLGMTPDEYRAKWGLQDDYPMVAPNYSATRSALAKSIGLGRSRPATMQVRGKRAKAS